jgi:PAS domain S-box-containing protein
MGGLELFARRKDGSEVPVEISLNPVDSGDGLLVTAALRDVTERRAAEQALREGEERYRLLVTQSVEAIYRCAPETGRVLEVNPAFLGLLGYTAEEAQALSLYDIVGHERPDVQAMLGRVMESGSLAIGPRRWRRKDGAMVDVDVTASVIRQQGKPSVYVVGRDMTAHRRAEEATRRSRQQLRDLARSLRAAREEERTLIARLIHDEMGNALNALRMDLSWLRGRLPTEAEPFRQKIRSMLGLIDATIAQARTLASELRPAVLDILGLVSGIEWELEQFGRRTGLSCELAAPDELPPLDPDRSTDLFRILQEALTNVAQHADARSVHVVLRSGPAEVTLEVRDDGRGISEVEISSPGALGLVGMRERALVWGGKVDIAGRPGEGTTVTACLPLPPTAPSDT